MLKVKKMKKKIRALYQPNNLLSSSLYGGFLHIYQKLVKTHTVAGMSSDIGVISGKLLVKIKDKRKIGEPPE